MLHEPEFESPEEAVVEETPKKTGVMSKLLRTVFYGGILAMFGIAVGVQASPEFAAQVGKMTPEPVAAAVAKMTGNEVEVIDTRGRGCCSAEISCCSSASRTSLLTSAEESSCCSKSLPASQSSESCCTYSKAAQENLASAETNTEEAISLPAPEETLAADVETSGDTELADDAI